jgi:cell division initiation protein
MNVSPLDLRQQRFNTAFRGYDRIEVSSFLLAVADDYEQALRETDRLRQDVIRMEAALAEHRDNERTLKMTLIAAQKMAEEIKASAEEDAARLLAEAQSRADLLVEQSRGRLDEIHREIDALKLKRRHAETSIEGSIQALRQTLEFVRNEDRNDREEKILMHRPRAADDSALQELRAVPLPEAIAG